MTHTTSTQRTLSQRMLHCLQQAREQLSDEARSRIVEYVRSQQSPVGGFVNRNGTPDLYYTFFGCALSFVFDIPIDRQVLSRYLSLYKEEQLDLVHYGAYIRCRMAADPTYTPVLRTFESFTSLPHNDPRSPYTRFLWLSLLEDAGETIERDRLRLALGSPDSVTNFAAYLMVIGQLDGYRHNVLIEALRRRQNELGGFAASSSSIAEADLLTTATALFALHSYRVPPMYDTALFILAHWQDTGGFSATLDSEECDVEYTYYGLLAIGSSII